MLIKNILNKIGFLIILSFTFFKFGKFILIFIILIFLGAILTKGKIKKNTFYSSKHFFLLLIIFIYAFIVSQINGNNIYPSLRDFNYIIYITLNILIFDYIKTTHDIHKYLFVLVKALYIISIFVITIWISLYVYPRSYSIFLFLENYSGFAFHFSPVKLNNGKYYYKIFSALSPMYLFLLPLTYNKYIIHKKKYFYIFLLIIILSASFAQFIVIIFYILFFIFFYKSSKTTNKLFLKFSFFITLGIIIFINTNISNIIKEKAQKLYNIDWNIKLEPTNINNGMNQRIIQMKIIFNEIANKPFLGNGLGFESIKYRDILFRANQLNKINPNRKVSNIEKFDKFGNRVNIGMYENQYLDIIMKFGFIFGIILFLVYFISPLYIFKYLKQDDKNLLQTVKMGFYGQIIFMGSNGNLFYSPFSMFIYGLIISIIYFYITHE